MDSLLDAHRQVVFFDRLGDSLSGIVQRLLRRGLARKHLFDCSFDGLARNPEDADETALCKAVVGRSVQLVDSRGPCLPKTAQESQARV